MSFWRRKKSQQHPPASSLLDDPVSDQDISSGLPPPAIPTIPTTNTNITADFYVPDQQRPIIDSSDSSVSPEPNLSLPAASSSVPTVSPSPIRRFSKYNPFRRSSSQSKTMDPPASTAAGTSPRLPPANSNNPPPSPSSKTPNPSSNAGTLSPQARVRTPSQSPYASPRTSIYGALSSPSTSSNPGEIFERSIESVPSVSSQSTSAKAVPTHQVLEDIIPPALEATAATFTDHVNPDNVEIVTFSEVQSSDSRSNAGSPVPASPSLSAPTEAMLNPWDTTPSSGLTASEMPASGSPDLDGKKRTLSLMSAVDHLAEEIIHPAVPASVDKRQHAVSPMSLSPAMTPADAPSRTATNMTPPEVSMERSPSQASTVGDVVVVKQTMGEALRQKSIYGAPPEFSRKDEHLDANPWS